MSKILFTETHWLWQGSTRSSSTRWPKGHGMIQRRNGVNCKIYAHRAAWILFYGPIPDDKKVLHRCPDGDIPYCVRPDHLMLGDLALNSQQATADGYNYFSTHSFKGEESHAAKATWEVVRQIREKRAAGALLRELSEQFAISIPQISVICRNKSWVE